MNYDSTLLKSGAVETVFLFQFTKIIQKYEMHTHTNTLLKWLCVCACTCVCVCVCVCVCGLLKSDHS